MTTKRSSLRPPVERLSKAVVPTLSSFFSRLFWPRTALFSIPLLLSGLVSCATPPASMSPAALTESRAPSSDTFYANRAEITAEETERLHQQAVEELNRLRSENRSLQEIVNRLREAEAAARRDGNTCRELLKTSPGRSSQE